MRTPLVPPAPIPPRRPSTWRFLRSLRRDILSTFAEESYERLTIRGSILGKPFLLVNEPAGIRRVLVDHAFNYVKPPSTIRVVSPFTGNGLLLAEVTRGVVSVAESPTRSRRPMSARSRRCSRRLRRI